MDKNLKKILVSIGILVLVALNIWVFIKYNFNDENVSKEEKNIKQIQNVFNQYDNSQGSQNSVEQIENSIDAALASMDERSRIERYFGKFINAIENKNYSSAYSMLNDSFKNTYFATQEAFEQYVSTKYPSEFIVVEYENIERQGELYVLTVSIDDGINQQFEKFEQRVVVRENGINDYTLSFQVQ